MKQGLSWLVLFLVFGGGQATAQVLEKIQLEHGCNYDTDVSHGAFDLEKPSGEADSIVNAILFALGQEQNFELRANRKIANARAAMKGERRLILYNEEFIASFKRNSLTNWAAYTLLAHEIGHHIKKHDFVTTDPKTRHTQELEADGFSGQVLARLGADLEEALAGVQSLEIKEATLTHPGPKSREEAIISAFSQERLAMVREQSLHSSRIDSFSEKTYLTLDQEPFLRNRWNLLDGTNVQAELDKEKITIRYSLPGTVLPGTDLTICLHSNNQEGVYPGAGLPSTVKGTGSVPYQKQGVVVWNYRLDGFTRSEVSKGGMLRLVVYDALDKPYAPGFWKKTGSWTTTILGGLAMGFGTYEMIKGNDLYQLYKTERDPGSSVYAEESRDERYARADKHFYRGQWIAGGGVALAAVGIVWLVDKKRHQRSYDLDGLCIGPNPIELYPIVSTQTFGQPMVGINLRF